MISMDRILLKPTVKRDLSLFSVKAWQRGYLEGFKNKFAWTYPIIFHYDGVKANFYHRAEDFKTTRTPCGVHRHGDPTGPYSDSQGQRPAMSQPALQTERKIIPEGSIWIFLSKIFPN